MSLFFYLFTFGISLWHPKFVTTVFVYNQLVSDQGSLVTYVCARKSTSLCVHRLRFLLPVWLTSSRDQTRTDTRSV